MCTLKTLLFFPDAAASGSGSSSSSQASSGTPSTGVVGGGAGSSAALGQADSAPSSGPSDAGTDAGVDAGSETGSGAGDGTGTDESIELSNDWDEPSASSDSSPTAETQDAGTDAAAAVDELSDAEADRLLSEWIASQVDPQPQADTSAETKPDTKPDAKVETKPDPKADAKTDAKAPLPAEVESLYTAVESELSQPAAKAFRTLVDGLRTKVEQISAELSAERESQKQARQSAETTQKYLAWKKETLPAVEAIDKLMEGDPRFGLAAKLARDEVTAEQFRPYQVLHKLAMGIQEQAKREGRELSVEALAKAAASRMRRMQPKTPSTASTASNTSAKPATPASAPKLKLPAPKQPANKPAGEPKLESEAEFLSGLSKDLDKFR